MLGFSISVIGMLLILIYLVLEEFFQCLSW